MSTPNDPSAALAEAVRKYLETYTGDYKIAEESKLGTALAAYEEAAKAVEPMPDNLDEPVFKLEDGSIVTGGRAASLLDDERRFHRQTQEELHRFLTAEAEQHAPAQPKREVSAKELINYMRSIGHLALADDLDDWLPEAERARADTGGAT